MFCFCFFRAFVPFFHFKLRSFCTVGGGSTIFFAPGRKVSYSYATGGGKDLKKFGKI